MKVIAIKPPQNKGNTWKKITQPKGIRRSIWTTSNEIETVYLHDENFPAAAKKVVSYKPNIKFFSLK